MKIGEENNLSSASVALVFQLRAIDKRRLKHKIGSLKNNDIIRIKQLIKNMMMSDKTQN